MTDQPIIQTQNLSKWYGEIMGVNDVTLTIKPGMTGLLGPNGAGKSTLLKLMTGQLKPNKGGLTVLGEPVWNNPETSGETPSLTASAELFSKSGDFTCQIFCFIMVGLYYHELSVSSREDRD